MVTGKRPLLRKMTGSMLPKEADMIEAIDTILLRAKANSVKPKRHSYGRKGFAKKDSFVAELAIYSSDKVGQICSRGRGSRRRADYRS